MEGVGSIGFVANPLPFKESAADAFSVILT
jgi:hypothetical protein